MTETIVYVLIASIVLALILGHKEKAEPPPPEIEDIDDDRYDHLF